MGVKLTLVTGRDRAISAEIGLPFLRIGTNDVGALFGRRQRRADGPFLAISASSGLALDTAFRNTSGGVPHLYGVHGEPQQLWQLVPSGHSGEVGIVSVANGLFLDARELDQDQGRSPAMRAEDGGAWQRWRLLPAPGGRHRIVNAGTGKALDCPHDAVWRTWPVLWEPHEGNNQLWLLAVPFAPAR